ncbi:hypothetical protein QBC35DRAFT_472342 [Podospora australis]|uniref:Uncharacterized protein n=1 Tax=Podospora australis TaxID=1536484 RepID=A0AAN6WY90_9PEZI|nr:hypothetical protein QBC35DRAFT_472342 [Podospora australis]
MPYKVEKQRKMPTTNVVNGDKPHSETLRHVLSYPTVREGLNLVQSNVFGQKALEISNAVYQGISDNVFPIVAGPYKYVRPYVQAVDQVGDQALLKIDEKLPIVTKPPGEIFQEIQKTALAPARIVRSLAEYLFSSYNSEVEKAGGNPVHAHAKGAVVTGLNIGIAAATQTRDYITSAKEEIRNKAQNAMA